MRLRSFIPSASVAAICLLLSLVVSLLPSVYLADLFTRPYDAAALGVVSPLQHALAIIILPPNFVVTTLGLPHLEFVHALEAPTAGSPPHDMTGCACSPAEMRHAFLLGGWPFWFGVFLLPAAVVRAIRLERAAHRAS